MQSTATVIQTATEQEWLEARRKYVTATDVARLARGGSAVWATVKAEKQGEVLGGFTNVYLEWGKAREPVILSHLAFNHGIEPNKSLYVKDRFAATPDGVGETVLAEVKTTVTDWGEDADIRVVKPEYYDQVQWQMMVCGYDKTVFAFEPHENFQPLPVRQVIIERDEERIGELIEVADRFLDYLNTERLVTNEYDVFLARYATARAEYEQAKAVLDGMQEELRERLGDDDFKHAGEFGSISYVTPKPRRVFDTAKFRAPMPDVAKNFMTTRTAEQPTLRITIKGDK